MAGPKEPDLSASESPPPCPDVEFDLLTGGELIGRGNHAYVRRVSLSEPNLPDTVAIKEPGVPDKTADRVTTFLKEAEIWQTVAQRERTQTRYDDYIVGVVAVGDDLPWIAMEYMDGGNLAERLEAHPDGLPIDEALWIAESLCKGLEPAHDIGIAHFDLKPSNILFRETTQGRWDIPKIADWGIARRLFDGHGSIDAFSPRYAAPEQFDPDEFAPPDIYTDIYQIGAVVYELLTGRPPYSGGLASIEYGTTSSNDPTPPSEYRKSVSAPVDDAVLTALKAEKTDRYRSIGRFEEAIHDIRHDELLEQSNSQPKGVTPQSPSQKAIEELTEFSDESVDRTAAETASQDNSMITDELPDFGTHNITVIGCGGAGNTWIDKLKHIGVSGATLVAVNTDAKHLSEIEADKKILIGREITQGRGAGSIPQVGEEAVRKNQEAIAEVVQDEDLVFVTAGLGGGTGTGASPVIAETARDQGAHTISVVTTPFSSEGKVHRNTARNGLARLDELSDTVIVFPNDRVLESYGEFPIQEAFEIRDQMVMSPIKDITELINKDGLVNLDFADIRTVIKQGNVSMIGVGKSDSAPENSVENALESPFFEPNIIEGNTILVKVTGGENMDPFDAEKAVDAVKGCLDSKASLIWGATTDEYLIDSIRITIIVTDVRYPDL